MWWLDAESPSGNAAAQVKLVEQASQCAKAVQQLQSELESRDAHIAAQSDQLRGLQRELQTQTACFARQHELAHKSRRAAQNKLCKTQSKLFAVIDRRQDERAEQARTSKDRDRQLAEAQSQQRELKASLSQLVDLHAVDQANLNAELGSLKWALSEQQRAGHEQLERHSAQVAELEVQHANRLTAQRTAAQAAEHAALLSARQAEMQHAATVEQLTTELTARSEQLAVRESTLAKALSEQRVTEGKLTAQAASLQLQFEQSRAMEAQFIQQVLHTKQQHDQQVGQLRTDIAQLQSSIDQQCLQDAAQRQALANLKSQHVLELATALREATIASAAELEQSKDQNTNLQTTLAARDQELVRLHSTIAQRMAERQQSESLNATLRSAFSDQQLQVTALLATIAQLESKLGEQAAAYQKLLDAARASEAVLNEQLASTNAKHAAQCQEIQDRTDQLRSSIAARETEVTDHQQLQLAYESKLAQLSATHHQFIQQASETEQNLRAELSDHEELHAAQQSNLLAANAQQQTTIAKCELTIDELQRQIARNADALTELVAELEQQQIDAQRAKADACARQEQLQRQNALDVQSLQSTIAEHEQNRAVGRNCIEELEARLFEEREARERQSIECSELNRALAEHRSSSKQAEASASERLADVHQQQAVEVAMLRSTLSALELALQNSSQKQEVDQAEQELAEREHAAEIKRQTSIHKRLRGELEQALQQNGEAAKQLGRRAAVFEQFVAGAHQRDQLQLAEIASLRHSDAELRQASVQLVRKLDNARAGLQEAAESEKALRELLRSLVQQCADLQTRLDETLHANREADGAHSEECNSLRGECEQMSCKLREQGKALSEALSELVETRSRLSEQTPWQQAEADMAEYSRSAEQSRDHASTWQRRLQKESAARRKAESALRRAAEPADRETIARVALAEIDARQRCERLATELVATRALAAQVQRRLASELKRAQQEVHRLRSNLDVRQAAAHTYPMPGPSEASVAEPVQWLTPQSKAS